MPKYFLSLFVLLSLSSRAQQSFVIEGQTIEKEAKKVMLMYFIEDKCVMDSASIVNGKFAFKGTIEHPALAYMNVMAPGGAVTPDMCATSFAVEAGKIKVRDIASNSKGTVTGSVANKQFSEWRKMLAEAGQMEDNVSKDYVKVLDKFVEKFPDSYVGLNLLGGILDRFLDETYGILKKLTPELQNTADGKTVERKYLYFHALVPGKPALDFTLNDTEGNPHKLSDYKGQYILLDFWASWCKPCREVNKHLVELEEKYKGRNFKIIGVSFDRELKPWQKAISEDKVTWLQLSDFLGMNKSKVAEMYNVHALPKSLVIDPDGNLVDISKGGAVKTIEEIFKDK